MKKLLSFVTLMLIVSVSFAQLGGNGKGYTKAQSDAKYLTKSDSSALITAPNYVTKKALQTALVGIVGGSTDTTYLSARIDSMVNKYTLVDPTNLIDSLAAITTLLDKTDNYTLQFSGAFGSSTNDLGKTITLTSETAKVITVPTNATAPFQIGSTITIIQGGSGEVSIAGSGVTFKSESSWVKIGAQESAIQLIKIATDTWRIIGRLKA